MKKALKVVGIVVVVLIVLVILMPTESNTSSSSSPSSELFQVSSENSAQAEQAQETPAEQQGQAPEESRSLAEGHTVNSNGDMHASLVSLDDGGVVIRLQNDEDRFYDCFFNIVTVNGKTIHVSAYSDEIKVKDLRHDYSDNDIGIEIQAGESADVLFSVPGLSGEDYVGMVITYDEASTMSVSNTQAYHLKDLRITIK